MTKILRRIIDGGRSVIPNANDVTEIKETLEEYLPEGFGSRLLSRNRSWRLQRYMVAASPAEVQKACSIIGHDNMEDGGMISRPPMRMTHTRRAIASTIRRGGRCWLQSLHVSSKKKLDDLAKAKRTRIKTDE
ncbi:hypothetical protein N7534_007055 [Penicillium rubens]|nr:hypothetical protein N7534_007055 [Penicillium rubens]